MYTNVKSFSPLLLISLMFFPLTSHGASNQDTPLELHVIGTTHPQGNKKGTELTKLPLTPREIPQSISIIGQQRIKQQNLNTLHDLLTQSTGVVSAPFHSYRTLYYVRGFQVNAFEIDGMPITLSTSASSPQDMSAYEHVELLRGANGLLHGDGNPGATINMVRKKAPHERLAEMQLQTGSWNRYRGQLDIGDELNSSGSLRGRAVMALEGRDFFFDRASQKTQSFFLTLDADVTSHTLWNIGAQYQSIRWKNPNIGGLPFSKNYEDLNLPRNLNLDADWTLLNFYTTRLFSSLTQEFSKHWKGKINLEYQRASANNDFGVYWGNVDKQTGDGGALTYLEANKFKNNSLAIDANISGTIESFGLSHQLIAGVSYNKADIARESAGYDYKKGSYLINVYHFDPYFFSQPTRLPYTPKVDTRQIEQGIYAMARIKFLPSITVVLGGRESWWRADNINDKTPGQQQFSPYGGVIWDLAKSWSWYASFANVYQPQSYYNWQGNPIDPIRGDSYETGIKAAFNNNTLNLSLAAFHINMNNNPLADPEHKKYYLNGKKATSQGIEVEINGTITPYWNLYAGYTWLNTRQHQAAISSKEVFNNTSPQQLFKLWTNYDLPWMQRKWSIGAGVLAQSYFISSVDHHIRQPGYLLANVRLAYQFNDNWQIAMNIDNLFDRRYYAGLHDAHYNNRYGTPRDISLTINGNFF